MDNLPLPAALALVCIPYLVAGGVGVGIKARYGRAAFLCFAVMGCVVAGAVWAWPLGDTYPARTRLQALFGVAGITGCLFAVPLYLVSQIDRRAYRWMSILAISVVTLLPTVYVMFAVSFRGV